MSILETGGLETLSLLAFLAFSCSSFSKKAGFLTGFGLDAGLYAKGPVFFGGDDG